MNYKLIMINNTTIEILCCYKIKAEDLHFVLKFGFLDIVDCGS